MFVTSVRYFSTVYYFSPTWYMLTETHIVSGIWLLHLLVTRTFVSAVTSLIHVLGSTQCALFLSSLVTSCFNLFTSSENPWFFFCYCIAINMTILYAINVELNWIEHNSFLLSCHVWCVPQMISSPLSQLFLPCLHFRVYLSHFILLHWICTFRMCFFLPHSIL